MKGLNMFISTLNLQFFHPRQCCWPYLPLVWQDMRVWREMQDVGNARFVETGVILWEIQDAAGNAAGYSVGTSQ